MRVVSPVAVSALAAISTQNLAESVLKIPFLPFQTGSSPDREVAAQPKLLKPLPIHSTPLPETLVLQQFAGIEAPLKLAAKSPAPALPTIVVPLQPSRPELLPMPETSAATLPPLDPIVNQVIQAELKQLYQNNPHRSMVARGFTPPPERMITAIRASQQSDRSSIPPSTVVTHAVPTRPAAEVRSLAPIASTPEPITSEPAGAIALEPNMPESDIPDYLLPRKAAAMGMDRIRARTDVSAAALPAPAPPLAKPDAIAATSHVVPTEPLLEPDEIAVPEATSEVPIQLSQPTSAPVSSASPSRPEQFSISLSATAAIVPVISKSRSEPPVAALPPGSATSVTAASLRVIPEQPQLIQVTIVGEVQYPGSYLLQRHHLNAKVPTITQALQQAGGLTQLADLRRVKVRRFTGTGSKTIVVDLQSLLTQGDSQADLILQRGDLILVPVSTPIDPMDAARVLPERSDEGQSGSTL